MREIDYRLAVEFIDDNDEFLKANATKKLPKHGSTMAAGWDVYAVGEPKIVGEREPRTNLWNRIDYIEYNTGIKLMPYDDFHTLAFPRSSISKYNLILANSVGVIDNDYRGELLLRFKYHWQPQDYVISRDNIQGNSFKLGVVGYMNWEKIYRTGDKICQLIGTPHKQLDFFEGMVGPTIRGIGGFGHTDKPC